MIENLLTYSIGSLIWGFLISLACLGVIVFLIKAWYNNTYLKPISYIITGIVGVILIYNSTIIVSAVSMKSDLDNYESMITQLVRCSYSAYDNIVDDETTNGILQHFLKENPILKFFICEINFEGATLSDISHILTESFKSDLNKVILKRVLWSILFIVIATVALVKNIGRTSNESNHRKQRSRYNFERVSTRRNRPISRRR